ncbi:hypothetical protein OFC04_25395, partial [Escherichia coli]|nr:hypothetical protein [Escherichia coli]
TPKTTRKHFTKPFQHNQIPQHNADHSHFIVDRAQHERQANVIRAEGEAESAETISKSIAKAGDGLIQIRKIEASREIAQVLAANPNVAYLPGGGKGTNLLMNVG